MLNNLKGQLQFGKMVAEDLRSKIKLRQGGCNAWIEWDKANNRKYLFLDSKNLGEITDERFIANYDMIVAIKGKGEFIIPGHLTVYTQK